MEILKSLATKTITIQRNDQLKTANTIDTNVYWIESGALQIYINDEHMEQIIRFGYEGNIITALDSYFSNSPSPLIIQALKKSVVYVIPKHKIDQFILDNNNSLFWRQILESLVLQQFHREIDILTSSPKERYKRVLARSPQLFQYIPHKYIANYLRMTPETLSRLKKS